MADKSKYIQDFRAAVAAMLEARERVQNLVTLGKTMGWQPADLTQYFSSSDITAEDFIAAFIECDGLAKMDTSMVLAKLRP